MVLWTQKIEEDDILSDEFKECFIDYLSEKKPNTIKGYITVVSSLCHKTGKDFTRLKTSDFVSYLDSLKNSKTYNVYLGYIRMLSSYTDKILNTNQYTKVSGIPKKERDELVDEKKVPSYEDVDKVLSYLKSKNDKNTFTAISVALILSLTTDEICSLKRKQFFIEKEGNAGLRMYESDYNDRFLYIPEDIKELIIELKADRTSTNFDDYLFLNRQGKKLSPRVIQKNIHSACLSCKVKPFSLSDLRTLSISQLRKSGAKEEELAYRNGTGTAWFFRYDRVVKELKKDPVKLNHISVRW